MIKRNHDVCHEEIWRKAWLNYIRKFDESHNEITSTILKEKSWWNCIEEI